MEVILGKVDEILGKVISIENEVGSIKTEQIALKETQNTLVKDISSLKTEVTSIKTELKDLKVYVNDAVSTVVETLHNQDEKAEQDRKDAKDRYEVMIEYKDDNMRIHGDMYKEVKSDVVVIKSDISALDVRVTDLEEK